MILKKKVLKMMNIHILDKMKILIQKNIILINVFEKSFY